MDITTKVINAAKRMGATTIKEYDDGYMEVTLGAFCFCLDLENQERISFKVYIHPTKEQADFHKYLDKNGFEFVEFRLGE